MEHNKKKLLSFVTLGLFAIFILGVLVLPSSISPSTTDSGEEVNYKGTVCIYTTGEFDGRESPSSEGIYETVQCNSNVLFDSGANDTVNELFGTGTGSPYTVISLCNATAACGTPLAAATESYVEYDVCGLANATGTFAKLGETGNATVTNTFTATCNSLETNVTRLENVTGTGNFSGNFFTLVTLQTNDQLTINWTLQIS